MSGIRVEPVTDEHRDWEKRVGIALRVDRLLFADVHIVNRETGETRLFVDSTGFRVEDDGIAGAIAAARYVWTVGNYACDCNRALMFARAGGEEDADVECGHDRFAIVEPDWDYQSPAE